MTDAPQPADTALPKTFDPASIEARWYAHWEQTGGFRPHRPDATPFTIVNPPPNVTGSLHIGHALDNTLQDVMVRYERLRGKDALWVVGTDHAGIATQMVVERELAKSQQKRTDFSREDFIAKVWEWKAESGGTITRQLRRLGCSMDWSREQFTMSPEFTRAVVKVFVDFHQRGLIYRDKRLVNWDPGLKTAISDLEVETREQPGKFWHFSYPLADGSGAIKVATTRPETMLADMAVAVHPGDARYTGSIGKEIAHPITGRRIPIIADEHADPELGSGAVKITPGHDFNDFDVGKRAGIAPGDMLNMLDADAKVVQTSDGLIPQAYLGLDRFDARARVVEEMERLGLLGDVEDRTIQLPLGDRSGQAIEPWLTDQWYVDAETLAGPAIEAVKSDAVDIVPKSWEKTFFHWMENIQPWCISRQLWWGHRIPAWYGPKKLENDQFMYGWVGSGDSDEAHRTHIRKTFVALNEADLNTQLEEYYGPARKGKVTYRHFESETEMEAFMRESVTDHLFSSEVCIFRDPDVLDTWFSSALWPFATLGWPESSPSHDGEGDHAKHGGGVCYKLPAKTNGAIIRAKAMRRAMPPSETALWSALKERPGGFKFRRQHPAGDYVLDFFCPQAGLVIEVDGEAHDRGNRPDRDALRDSFLRDCGIDIMRIPAREVFGDLDAVVAGIVERSRERLPLHQPVAGPPPRHAGEDSLLARHYPNDLLISGFDILFFWDARMLMQGIELTGTPPWKTLYLHGLVRAADGQKMSKSKGNTVDPLGLIDQYGADALRFFMAAMESQGRDIKMDEARLAGYRNFATKLWNACRFAQSNGITASTQIAAPPATLAVNKWIIGEVVETQRAIDTALAAYRFDDAANAIYHFTWDRFCDWYLELVKPILSSPSPDGEGDQPQAGGGVGASSSNAPPPPAAVPLPGKAREAIAETKSVAGWAIDQILVMLHPFMPFITEELWHAMGAKGKGRGDYDLVTAKWPEPDASVDNEATAEIDWLIEVVREVRSAKNELGIAPGAQLTAYMPEAFRDRANAAKASLGRLARLGALRFGETPPGPSMQVVVAGETIALPLEGVIDLDAERARLKKALDAAEKEGSSLAARLANPAFVEKAKPEAVEKARADHAEKSAEAERLSAALDRLA